MKRIHLFPCAAALLLCACNSSAPLNTGGDYDPFVAPGMNHSGLDTASARGVKAGTIVHTIVGNAAFFKKRPDGSANADKLLPVGTEMKAISDDLSYMKVELNSGDVGYIPSVQVSDQKAVSAPMPAMPAYNTPGAVQVYPPIGPSVTPAKPLPDQPVIPATIDPESPSPKVPAIPPAGE